LKKICLLVLILLLTGCATVPPAKHDFQSGKIYKKPYDDVWKHAALFFKDRDIPLKTIEKASGTIVTEEMKIPYRGFLYESDYCDCGRLSGLYVYHEILGKFSIIVKKLAGAKTSVQVNANYKASKWLGKNFKGWVICESKGHAEKILLEHLDSALEGQEKETEASDEEAEGGAFL